MERPGIGHSRVQHQYFPIGIERSLPLHGPNGEITRCAAISIGCTRAQALVSVECLFCADLTKFFRLFAPTQRSACSNSSNCSCSAGRSWARTPVILIDPDPCTSIRAMMRIKRRFYNITRALWNRWDGSLLPSLAQTAKK